jgi:type IV secretory pathway TrbF-like protein
MKNLFEKYEIELKRKNILLLLSLLIIILLSSTIISLIFQQKQIKFVPYTTNSEGNIKMKIVDDSEISTSTRELIIEYQLKEYVKERFSNLGGRKYNGDEISLKKIEFIKAFSSRNVYNKFIEEFEVIFEKANFWKRDVEILDIIKQEPKKYFVKARFNDHYEGDIEPKSNDYNFFLKYNEVEDQNFTPEQIKINPLGIKINWFRYGNKIL